jgi:hypothetical protein
VTITAELDAISATAQIAIADPTLVVASSTNTGPAPPTGVDFFPAFADGNVAPIRSIRGAATTLTGVWSATVAGQDVFVGAPSEVAVFPIDGDGNIAPIRRITGPTTLFTAFTIPYSMTTYNGELYVGVHDATDRIEVFPLSADGDVAPTRVISGPATGLSDATGLVIYKDELYVANQGNSTITVYPFDANGEVAPTRTISGPQTQLFGPSDLVIRNDELWVANDYGGLVSSITSYLVTADGNGWPIRRVEGAQTGLYRPSKLLLVGNELYMANWLKGRIEVFPAVSSGDLAPTRTLGGVNTMIASPWGLGIY